LLALRYNALRANTLDKVMPANVGVLLVAISCGVDSVIAPAELVTVILFVVPVRFAAIGDDPVDPIISCPFVSV